MSTPLEEAIMREIGLGEHYSRLNGDESCQTIRQEAASNIHAAIQKHHDAKEQIAPPDDTLIWIMQWIAKVSEAPKSLRKTWLAASWIISEHIRQANAAPEIREKAFRRLETYLEENYLFAQE